MKRIALFAATAFMALLISACGDNAEKKVETKATTTVDQAGTAEPTSTTTTTTDTKSE